MCKKGSGNATITYYMYGMPLPTIAVMSMGILAFALWHSKHSKHVSWIIWVTQLLSLLRWRSDLITFAVFWISPWAAFTSAQSKLLLCKLFTDDAHSTRQWSATKHEKQLFSPDKVNCARFFPWICGSAFSYTRNNGTNTLCVYWHFVVVTVMIIFWMFLCLASFGCVSHDARIPR